MKMLIAALGAAALAVPTLAAPVAAVPANPFVQDHAVLHHADLDLATADGQRRLAERLDVAASAVCGDRLASVHLALAAQARACKAEVIANARMQIEAIAALPGAHRYAAAGVATPAS